MEDCTSSVSLSFPAYRIKRTDQQNVCFSLIWFSWEKQTSSVLSHIDSPSTLFFFHIDEWEKGSLYTLRTNFNSICLFIYLRADHVLNVSIWSFLPSFGCFDQKPLPPPSTLISQLFSHLHLTHLLFLTVFCFFWIAFSQADFLSFYFPHPLSHCIIYSVEMPKIACHYLL